MKLDYLGLHNIIAASRKIKKPKRVGRGESSGWGKTAGRGHKGQKARKSGNVRFGFEGGQNPLINKLPKRGFTRMQPNNEIAVNIDRLCNKIKANSVVTIELLKKLNIIKSNIKKIKILNTPNKIHLLNIKGHSSSKSLEKRIKSLSTGEKIEHI